MKIRGVVGVWLAVLVTAHGYDFIGSSGTRWPDGPIPMSLQLDLTMEPRPLMDGKNSWDAVALEAMNIWNAQIDRVQFTSVEGTLRRDGNRRNEVFFSSTVYGRRFGPFVLAVTSSWRVGRERVEGDTIFNTAIDWDSYRGNLDQDPMDMRRVAIHEFGHTLGLDHPDQARQVEVAVMNSTVSDLDTIALDDIRGARALYPPDTTYALDVVIDPPDMGRVLLNPPPGTDGRYPAGTFVMLTAQPNRRHRFNTWSGDREKKNRVLRVQVVGDETIVANFSTNAAPRILTHPNSRHVDFSDTVGFTVRAASGTPVEYQWQLNGADIPGANSPELFLTFVTHADSGVYSCRVANERGVAVSRGARLVVEGY
jgi:hypothetical protein